MHGNTIRVQYILINRSGIFYELYYLVISSGLVNKGVLFESRTRLFQAL